MVWYGVCVFLLLINDMIYRTVYIVHCVVLYWSTEHNSLAFYLFCARSFVCLLAFAVVVCSFLHPLCNIRYGIDTIHIALY